jgi:tripartite-type tricarboxylate transporter receptor subunit TctC
MRLIVIRLRIFGGVLVKFSGQRFAAACACLAVLTASSVAHAQQWPERTVKVVVPYGAGGVTDTMARVTAHQLENIFHQSFIVEDKPGAGGTIGVAYAMHAPQDGYTILFIGSTLFTVLPLSRDVDYVPLKDLVPVSIVGTNGMIMAVPKDSPYTSFAQFIDYARSHPGKISYSSGGTGGNNHLVSAYLAGLEKLDMVHVPFTGGQGALEAVLSKSVDMHFGNSSDLVEPAKNGSVRALAVSTLKRMPQLPDVPTVSETFPGFEYIGWNGYAVTGGVPAEVKDKLAKAVAEIARNPEVIKTFEGLAIDTTGTSPEEAVTSIQKDMAKFAQIVDMAGLRKADK